MNGALGFIAQHLLGLGTGTIVTAVVAFGYKKFVSAWLANIKSSHFQNAIVLGASLAKEICLGLHDSNIFQGSTIMPKLEEAATQLVKSMADAGHTITIEQAKATVQTAHMTLSLSTGTRYNDAPSMTVFGAKG